MYVVLYSFANVALCSALCVGIPEGGRGRLRIVKR